MKKNTKRSKRLDFAPDISEKTGQRSSGGERIILDGDDDLQEKNPRYERAILPVRIMKYLALGMFFAFFLCMITVFSDEITAENFRYVIKDLNLDLPTETDEFGQMYYVSQAEHSFGMFRGDLVSLGGEKLEIISPGGDTVQSTSLKYLRPAMEISEKYILVYDLSGNSYSVFNAFSPVYEEELDYPISCAAVSDTGLWLIVTSDAQYKSVVYIYDRSMERAYIYRTNDKYIFDAVLMGEDFMLLTATAEGGFYKTELLMGNVRSESMTTVYSASGVYPVRCGVFNGGVAAVLEDRIAVIEDGSVTEYSLKGNIAAIDIGNGTVAAATENEGRFSLFVLCGDERYTADLEGKRTDISACPGGVLILSSGRVEYIDAVKDKKYFIDAFEGNALDCISYSDSVALVLTETRAYPVSLFEDLKKVEG